jgi:hypothetical protein
MQFTIKTQEISKPFSLRIIPISSQDEGLSRYAPIEVLGCHYRASCQGDTELAVFGQQ